MKLQALCFVLAVLSVQVLPAQEKEPPTAQTKRGRDLFLKSQKGTPCATCHMMAGIGTAVGPNLANLTALATPRGVIAAMQMTITENVQRVKTANGTFPGIQKQKQGDEFEIWDLGQTPPVLRKLTSKEITSIDRDQQWKHPPASADYTSQELADIVGFLRWATNGTQKEIKASDIE
jgi:mono/diheme cytochrome c family protein